MLFALLFTLCYRAAYKIYIGFYYTYTICELRKDNRKHFRFLYLLLLLCLMCIFGIILVKAYWFACLFFFFNSIFLPIFNATSIKHYSACACMRNPIFINLGYMFILAMVQRCIYDYKFTDYKMLGLVQLGENGCTCFYI